MQLEVHRFGRYGQAFLMKYRLLLIMTVLTFPSLGQEIEKVIFTSQQADEPPTKQERPKFTIEYTRQNGELIASDIYKDKKKTKLKVNQRLTKNELEK
jgi:hypothetical protein